jgi:hypothetical protein
MAILSKMSIPNPHQAQRTKTAADPHETGPTAGGNLHDTQFYVTGGILLHYFGADSN